MTIVKVIVDVPASTINQTFDYAVPKNLEAIVQPGMRVVVPFGVRTITGFIVNFTKESEVENLKYIVEILDLTPVLTHELIRLGKWLADETLSLYITVFQAMLPQVFKSTYEKELIKLTDAHLPEDIENMFGDFDTVPYEAIEQAGVSYSSLQKCIEEGYLYVNYIVKSRVTKKYATFIKPQKPVHMLEEALLDLSQGAKKQREVLSFFIQMPQSIEQKTLLETLNTTTSPVKALSSKGLLSITREEVYRNPFDDDSIERTEPLALTDEQAKAIEPVKADLAEEKHRVHLIHGVTGSGKTEIYLQIIQDVIEQGKEAIVLVPEISLTPQMVRRFKGRFGKQVAVLHSALSAGEKYDEWRRIHQKTVNVVVGARSAVFAPFEHLGVIIIDEEHETTYKQEEQPRYHARDVAVYRGREHNCPVILGSATPSLESYARAQKGRYELAVLKERTNKQTMPDVNIVDMRNELHAGNRTMFSRELIDSTHTRIEQGEQIVLLLNRRGYSTFVMCRDCGHVSECPNCDIALTFHKNANRLKCHYCGYEEKVPLTCPACASDMIRYFGTGTQKVEEALVQLLPEARVIRMDVDTTRRKGSHERLLQKFGKQEADILLGTQMIAKGLDFKNVTLVGVLTADSMLHLPDFRSAEKTFQLLTQVSGRAGRHSLPGEVIVQTYTPEHYSIELASTYQFEAFYKREMMLRKTFQYPPFVFLALITISHPEKLKVVQTSQTIAGLLSKYTHEETTILGPTPSPIARMKNRFRYQCMVKYKYEPNLKQLIQKITRQFDRETTRGELMITVDMQPYQLM
ncbi:Primosomal protein N' [Lentibacillus sp. JNUCC-1]|uniref:primosomal protein N' n=1 Tax=Lentibacillus sp. JNUCC-1 TaxID=2654513 RepID=UPI001320B87F|nr:Primosomal protein N' [Lentibacillus sp. JNUCC-1]